MKWLIKFRCLDIHHTHTHTQWSTFLQVQSLVPWLSVVLKLLKEAQEVAQDFTDKVTDHMAVYVYSSSCIQPCAS